MLVVPGSKRTSLGDDPGLGTAAAAAVGGGEATLGAGGDHGGSSRVEVSSEVRERGKNEDDGVEGGEGEEESKSVAAAD
jgi:hypothetical protein